MIFPSSARPLEKNNQMDGIFEINNQNELQQNKPKINRHEPKKKLFFFIKRTLCQLFTSTSSQGSLLKISALLWPISLKVAKWAGNLILLLRT